MVPASAGRREPKKILAFRASKDAIFSVNWVSSAGPVEMLNAGGGHHLLAAKC